MAATEHDGITGTQFNAETKRLAQRIRLNSWENEDGCWLWKRSTTKGYGRISVLGRPRGVHRVSYEVFVGPIPDGLEIDHLCRRRSCCNPAHLEPVTHRENQRRRRRSAWPPFPAPPPHTFAPVIDDDFLEVA